MIDILDREILQQYLIAHQLISEDESFSCKELSGGVSCKVVKVTTPSNHFVIKQARPQLQVKDEWLSDIRRIFIERDCMKTYNQIIPDAVPEIIAHDDENYLIVMEAAPEVAVTWKDQLLKGRLDFGIAKKIALALAKVHSTATHDENIQKTFENQQFFKELRINPYLETVQQKYPSLHKEIDKVISMLIDKPITLVHGDYSPKNILVADDDIFIIDLEVAHIGHPSFDLGFLTNHLLLKAIKHKEWAPSYMNIMTYFIEEYLSNIDYMDSQQLEEETVQVLALLFLARVDGKSPAEYITEEADKQLIRKLSQRILKEARTYEEVRQIILQAVQMGRKQA